MLNNHNTRGIRNNNPFNLIRTNIAWQGKIPHPQNPDKQFEQFTSIEYGIRAGLKDVINDISKGKNTVSKLISEFAPSFENNTPAYIASVAKTLGITADTKIKEINSAFLLKLARAIMKVELGNAHTEIRDAVITKAIKMIGDVSTANLKVSLSNGSILDTAKKYVLPILITAGVFFYTCLTLTI